MLASRLSPSVYGFVERVGALSTVAVPRLAFQRNWGVEIILDVNVPYMGRTERWKIVGQNPCTFRMFVGPATPLVYTEEHVVLREYTEPWAELTFHGRFRTPAAVIGALYEAHAGWARGWSPFDQFLAATGSLSETLAGGFGRLAFGPVSLMRVLAEALVPFELKPAVIPVRRAQSTQMSALLMRSNFVVAHELVAKRIPYDAPVADAPRPGGLT